ncbi:MAG: hypothetical protein GW809_04280 [Bacteroidetes bacterium]|nr:hypothetical protein [Bacteroidota bacterium]NCQ11362.1 hypothetical protein [Bacteroidota bacterium]
MFKKYSVLLITVIILASCAQIGTLALKFMTAKEKDLSKMAVVGQYQTNVYPKEVNTLGMKYAKNWEDAGSAVIVQFIKYEGIGMFQLDGTVLVNGDTAQYEMGGVYVAWLNKNDKSTKKVEIHSNSGQKTSFEIAPAPVFSIKSINGKTSDYEVDLTKDLVLEFDLSKEAKGKLMVASMISSFPGGTDFNNFQPFYAAKKVVIPAGSFTSTQVSGAGLGGKNVVEFIKENQWLKIELYEETRADLEPTPYFRKRSTHMDTKKITLKGDIESWVYYSAKGEIPVADEKPLKYEGSATQGYYGGTLEIPKLRIGIASLGINASLFKQTTSKNSRTVGDIEYVTTTITTYQFPQLDDVYWDEYMKSLYLDYKKMLESYGVEVVDLDKVMADPNYDSFFVEEAKNTEMIFQKYYKNSKRLSVKSISEIMSQVKTGGITDDVPKAKLLKSLNVDAIATLSLNFTIAGQLDKVVLYPNYAFMIEGKGLADYTSVTSWYQGSGYRSRGVPFSEAEFTSVAALNRILQKDIIMQGIKNSVEELVAKQRKDQVKDVWKLMQK